MSDEGFQGVIDRLRAFQTYDVGAAYLHSQKGSQETRARLGRLVANKEWLTSFSKAVVENGFANSYVHAPIVLSIGGR